MKTTLIALATVFGLSGAAYAMDDADKAPSNSTIQTETLTQSSSHGIQAPASEGYASKAGIDVNPNFLPHF